MALERIYLLLSSTNPSPSCSRDDEEFYRPTETETTHVCPIFLFIVSAANIQNFAQTESLSLYEFFLLVYYFIRIYTQRYILSRDTESRSRQQ